ncbi:Bro-N domain-containing protein [Acinetobacter sp. VT 511]|uniref:BRO-N domain-containing protein n=1 Tax=Acinetobacter sp. VT 511 TaxID=1675902 RepID=UPI00069FD9AB|nr:Bro-N domain-containing protein [Acinetobacter sp. VT 511]
MNSLALTFNDVNLIPLSSSDHHVWIGSTQIGLALGYANPETAITKIFNRKSDEFTSDMTRLVEVQTNGGIQQIRAFSLRGCHLITFFARTPVAKEFRKWVLDVLEKEVLQQQIDTRVKINAEQQAILKEIVDRRCEGNVKKRTELWSRHNQHFRIPRYSELLAIHFQDAVDYLETMQIKAKGDVHIDENQSIEMLCSHARLFQAWWNTHSPTLAKLNPQLVYMLHDIMFSMNHSISDLCKKFGISLPTYAYDHMFELKTLPHERYRLLK